MTGMRQFVVALAGILIVFPGGAWLLARDIGLVDRMMVQQFAWLLVPVVLVTIVVVIIERSGADALADPDTEPRDERDGREARDERRVRAGLRTSRDVIAVPADRGVAR